MRRDDVLKVMTFSLRVGEEMLESAVATSDVEQVMRRLTHAYDLPGCEVSVTLNVITLSYVDPYEGPLSMFRVVDIDEPRYDEVVALDTLSRRAESGELSIDEATAELVRIEQSANHHPFPVTLAAAMASVAGWVVFTGGGFVGATAGMVAALLVEVVVRPLARPRLPVAFVTLCSAVVAAGVPTFYAWLELPIALTPAIVGALIPLLPGGALVASVSDGLSGAPLSSMAKGLQATLTAVAVAMGALVVLSLGEQLQVVAPLEAVPATPMVAFFAALIGVSGFAVARSLPWRMVPGVMLVTGVTWGVAQVGLFEGGTVPVATFVAAVSMGLVGQLVARLQRTTAVIHTTTAVYVLVPGVAFYLSMLAIAQGATEAGTELLVTTIGVAIAIAAGIALGVAIGRGVPAPRPRVRVWARPVRRRG